MEAQTQREVGSDKRPWSVSGLGHVGWWSAEPLFEECLAAATKVPSAPTVLNPSRRSTYRGGRKPGRANVPREPSKRSYPVGWVFFAGAAQRWLLGWLQRRGKHSPKGHPARPACWRKERKPSQTRAGVGGPGGRALGNSVRCVVLGLGWSGSTVSDGSVADNQVPEGSRPVQGGVDEEIVCIDWNNAGSFVFLTASRC